MRSAKEIKVIPVHKREADKLIIKHHYSKKVTQNSQINFAVLLDGRAIGALQFGPSIDKRKTGPSIGCGMNDYLELNRMAIEDVGIKNIESRAISVCLKIIKKKYPFLKAVLSFADACQCGDGTIYRASGFNLLAINKNKTLFSNGNTIIADKTLNDKKNKNGKSMLTEYKKLGFKPLIGYQFKYVFYFDKKKKKKQKFIKFDEIPVECRMYLSKRGGSIDNDASDFQLEEGGVIPTPLLQKK